MAHRPSKSFSSKVEDNPPRLPDPDAIDRRPPSHTMTKGQSKLRCKRVSNVRALPESAANRLDSAKSPQRIRPAILLGANIMAVSMASNDSSSQPTRTAVFHFKASAASIQFGHYIETPRSKCLSYRLPMIYVRSQQDEI
ncbi:unnamed protein product [Pseudo-nitzschia multistriata]|uniref:Uncharacterized protein n=1 Tax=Pseudo-nitzschia multistriata TaxID=183589 RepID=A0A448Z681_9STRA|nr:unnamed protein product [Pseudo-nitzschia multistriata]